MNLGDRSGLASGKILVSLSQISKEFQIRKRKPKELSAEDKYGDLR